MKAKKALYITNLGLLENLAETQVLPYLEGLSRRGVGIHILSFEKRENLRDAARVDAMKKRLDGSGICWERLVYHNRWGNIWDVMAGFFKALFIAGDKKIGVLHARASIPMIIAWPVAKILGRKLIYDRRGTMAGDFVDDVNVKNIFSIRMFSATLEALDNFMVRHSDVTVVLSDRALKLLKGDKSLQGAGVAIESIPCCADMSRFREVKSPNQLDLNGRFVMSYLGSLGTCYLLKEMAGFYRALKGVKEDAVFLIISHTPEDFIRGILEKEGLEPVRDYIIIGVRAEDVPGYLSHSHCSIMFIKPVACKIGASPTKFGESLAAGIPVIVNKGIGDTEEIIRTRNIGVIVGGFDKTSYAKAISGLSMLLKDEGLKKRCHETADEFFSLDMGIERYLKVYERLTR